MDNKFKIWLEEHKAFCTAANDFVKRTSFVDLIGLYGDVYDNWILIDRKKDKSLSSRDLRLYIYLRIVAEHKYKK